MFIDKLFDAIFEIAKQHPEGFTLDLTKMELVTTGISVGHKETQNAFGLTGLDKCIRHALYNHGVVGGWRNPDGMMQFDSVRMFTDLRKAVRWGRKQRQYAIFDIDNGWEIVL